MFICHDRKVKLEENKIITIEGKEFNHLNEYLLSGYCHICKKLYVLHMYETYNGNKLKREYIGKRGFKFLSKILQKTKMFKSQQVDYRLFLNYNEHGLTKKCYSNLSNIKIGKEDTYQGLNKDYNTA